VNYQKLAKITLTEWTLISLDIHIGHLDWTLKNTQESSQKNTQNFPTQTYDTLLHTQIGVKPAWNSRRLRRERSRLFPTLGTEADRSLRKLLPPYIFLAMTGLWSKIVILDQINEDQTIPK